MKNIANVNNEVNNEEEVKMMYKFAIKGYCKNGSGGYEIYSSTGYCPPQSSFSFAPMSGTAENTTVERMELTAAIRALKCTPENSSVEITTTCAYLSEGIGQTHADNVDLWNELETLVGVRNVSFVYVEDFIEKAIAKNEEAVKMKYDEIRTLFRAVSVTKTLVVPNKTKGIVSVEDHDKLIDNYVDDLVHNKNTALFVPNNKIRVTLEQRIKDAFFDKQNQSEVYENATGDFWGLRLMALADTSEHSKHRFHKGDIFRIESGWQTVSGTVCVGYTDTGDKLMKPAFCITTADETRVLVIESVEDLDIQRLEYLYCEDNSVIPVDPEDVIATYGFVFTSSKRRWDRVYVIPEVSLQNSLGLVLDDQANWFLNILAHNITKNGIVIQSDKNSVSWEQLDNLASGYGTNAGSPVSKTVDSVGDANAQNNGNKEKATMVTNSETAGTEAAKMDNITAVENSVNDGEEITMTTESKTTNVEVTENNSMNDNKEANTMNTISTTNVKTIKLHFDAEIESAKSTLVKSRNVLAVIRQDGKAEIAKLKDAENLATDKIAKKAIKKSLQLFRAELAVKRTEQQIIIAQDNAVVAKLKLAKIKAVQNAENGTAFVIETEQPAEIVKTVDKQIGSDTIPEIFTENSPAEAMYSTDESEFTDDDESLNVEIKYDLDDNSVEDTSTEEAALADNSELDNEIHDDEASKTSTESNGADEYDDNPVDDVIVIEANGRSIQVVGKEISSTARYKGYRNFRVIWDEIDPKWNALMALFTAGGITIENVIKSDLAENFAATDDEDDEDSDNCSGFNHAGNVVANF